MPAQTKKGTRGRPSSNDESRRKAWFTFRANEEEKAEITRKAGVQKQPVSVYVRRAAYRGWIRNTEAVDLFIRATRNIDDELALLDQSPDSEVRTRADRIRKEVREIRSQIPKL